MRQLYRSWVEAQVAQTIELWNSSAESSVLGGLRYSVDEQQRREKLYSAEFHRCTTLSWQSTGRRREASRKPEVGGSRGDADVLRLTCAKGGSSALADACLIRGWLNEQESRFSFDQGVFRFERSKSITVLKMILRPR